MRQREKLKKVCNPDGVGGMMPGDVWNPTGIGGFSDNPSVERLTARYRAGFQRGGVANPYGQKGFKSVGKKTVKETKGRSRAGLMKANKHREIQEIARLHSYDAMQTLADILNSETSADQAKISAANLILERAYGKATQTNVNANVEADGKTSEVNNAELDRRIADTLKRVEAITNGAREEAARKERPADLRKLN